MALMIAAITFAVYREGSSVDEVQNSADQQSAGNETAAGDIDRSTEEEVRANTADTAASAETVASVSRSDNKSADTKDERRLDENASGSPVRQPRSIIDEDRVFYEEDLKGDVVEDPKVIVVPQRRNAPQQRQRRVERARERPARATANQPPISTIETIFTGIPADGRRRRPD
jgi:hypothetical protein